MLVEVLPLVLPLLENETITHLCTLNEDLFRLVCSEVTSGLYWVRRFEKKLDIHEQRNPFKYDWKTLYYAVNTLEELLLDSDLRVVQLALDNEANPNYSSGHAKLLIDCGNNATYPLGHACKNGRVEVVKLLLERGANPNACYNEAVYMATDCRTEDSIRIDIVRLLLDHPSDNIMHIDKALCNATTEVCARLFTSNRYGRKCYCMGI